MGVWFSLSCEVDKVGVLFSLSCEKKGEITLSFTSPEKDFFVYIYEVFT